MSAPNDPAAAADAVAAGAGGPGKHTAGSHAAQSPDPASAVSSGTSAAGASGGSGAPPYAGGVDGRGRRLSTGPSGPPVAGAPERAVPRGESQLGGAYGSEVPDLSEPAPRPVQRAPRTRSETTVRPRGPVRASMQIRRIDPWSTLKVSLLLAVSSFFVWMIAVALLYLMLAAMGVWSKLSTSVQEAVNPGGPAGELVSAGSIFGGAALIGLVNIVLITAMATLGAVIYNLSTDLVGGIEVTLADRD